jgi:hypothetical protein
MQGDISCLEISYNLQGRHMNATHTRLKESETIVVLKEGRPSALHVRTDRKMLVERRQEAHVTYRKDAR